MREHQQDIWLVSLDEEFEGRGLERGKPSLERGWLGPPFSLHNFEFTCNLEIWNYLQWIGIC